MFRKSLSIIALLVFLLIGGDTYLAFAQDNTPPPKPGEMLPFEENEYKKLEPQGGRASSSLYQGLPAATGGPDYFGYTWDDGVAFNWVGATNGLDIGISGDSDQRASILSLPFDFHYYDEIYDKVVVAASGYLGFTSGGWWPNQQNPLPSSETPNNIIAPFWTVMYLDDTGPTGRVYYRSGGTAPNRYVVVEWYNVAGGTEEDDSGGDETYRFEVVLYESGDILFQYHTMVYNDWRYYASIGIEDWYGDGLGYMDWGNYWDRLPASGQAILFSRPAPSAYLGLSPLHAGVFTHAGQPSEFELTVRNTGELGTDVYDLEATSSWPVTFHHQGGQLLNDTDSDGIIDSGSLAQGDVKTVIARIQTPLLTNVADSNMTQVTLTSSLDVSKSKTATLQVAAPATFVQAYIGDDLAMSNYMVRPDKVEIKKATPDSYLGWVHAITETPGFIYIWSNYTWKTDTSIGYSNIEYALLDDQGNRSGEIRILTDNSTAMMDSYDWYPAVAALPNGNIGVSWYRFLSDDSVDKFNYNIWFAVLDSSGNVVYGPENMTMNSIWGDGSDYDIPIYREPRITATDDNRFILAWRSYTWTSSGTISDIHYMVRDSNGLEILPATKFTYAVPGAGYYYAPNLTSLDNNRALLVYRESYSGNGYFAVLDSNGAVVKSETNAGINGYNPDAVQLTGGNILIASDGLEYVVLDGSSYGIVAGPSWLTNPASVIGDAYVSVTRDDLGHGILTWIESDIIYRRNIFYALIDGNGNILTQPMIFHTSEEYMETNISGYGNTSYSTNSTTGGVDMYVQSSNTVSGQPGGTATIPIRFGNLGLSTATSVTISATLDSNLSYISDTSGVIPIQSGDDLIWSIPTDLDFLGNGAFRLTVGVSNLPYGTLMPITIGISSTELDADTSNNQKMIDVMVASQLFLPIARR
jgi:uncharacterized repeat protein (TIGR01451 family)